MKIFTKRNADTAIEPENTKELKIRKGCLVFGIAVLSAMLIAKVVEIVRLLGEIEDNYYWDECYPDEDEHPDTDD